MIEIPFERLCKMAELVGVMAPYSERGLYEIKGVSEDGAPAVFNPLGFPAHAMLLAGMLAIEVHFKETRVVALGCDSFGMDYEAVAKTHTEALRRQKAAAIAIMQVASSQYFFLHG